MQTKTLNIIRVLLLIFVVVTWSMYLTGCTSPEERQDYREAQVKVIATQVDAKSQQGLADAGARRALYEAMARVAATSPDSADAIAVALAVSSVREEAANTDGPMVQLQREENGAVEVAKALAPALITTLGTVGVAALQSSVNKTQSDNAAAVSIAQAQTEASVMTSVTAMATTGLLNSGSRVTVGRDYISADSVDQSVATSSTSNQSYAESNTATETNTTTETMDSYNQVTSDSGNVYESTSGGLLSFEDIKAVLAGGGQVTVVINGVEVEVTEAACEDGSTGLTFGGGSVVCG